MSKKICFLMILLLILCLSSSCQTRYLEDAFVVVYTEDGPSLMNPSGETYSLAHYDEIIPEFDETLIVGKLIKQQMKYGYIKATGEVLLKPQYDQAGLMRENKAIVTQGNNQFIINPKGEVLYTFPEHLKAYQYFQEGYLVVEILSTGKWTFMDEHYMLWDKSYDYAAPFFHDYAIVGNIVDGIMYYQLVDKNGVYVGSQKYHFADYFYEGWARVGLGNIVSGRLDTKTIRYHYIDQNGNSLLDENNQVLKFDYARNFHEGLAFIGNYESSNDNEFIYKKYNLLSKNGFFPYQKEWNSFILGTGGYFLSVGDVYEGAFVINGHHVINAHYIVKLFTDETTNRKYYDKLELKKLDGTVISSNPINITNLKISQAYNNKALAKVQLANQLYGLVDSNGTYILEPIYLNLFY